VFHFANGEEYIKYASHIYHVYNMITLHKHCEPCDIYISKYTK